MWPLVPVRPRYANDGLGRFAIDHSWEPLNNYIHDHYLARPVDFVVTDGLQATSHGPLAAGVESLEGAQMNMRLILAGKDALAVDTVHALITGVDPQNVDYFIALANDNVGIMDPARINVVGNVRVDQVHKPFGFPGFPYFMMNPVPRTTIYTDFESPQVTIQNAELLDGTLTADLSSNKDLVKLEVFADGSLVEVIQVSGLDVELSITNDQLSPDATIAVYAYDQYLNCAETQVTAQ